MSSFERAYPQTWISHTVMGMLATIAIVLRFVARQRTKAKLQWDDWLSLLALLFLLSDFTCTIVGVYELQLYSDLTHGTLEHLPRLKNRPTQDLSLGDQNMLLRVSFPICMKMHIVRKLIFPVRICLYPDDGLLRGLRQMFSNFAQLSNLQH